MVGKVRQQRASATFMIGIGITLLIALAAAALSELPLLSVMGQLVIAILLGMLWRAVFGIRESLQAGITFSNSKLLRLGIILLGMRLNLADLYEAGGIVILIAVIVIVFTLFTVYGLSRWFGVEKRVGLLTACGTAICGAAAVVAIAPQIKASKEETAVGAATVAILGTVFTLVYTVLYTVLNLTPIQYGIFAGGTLHEIAHVIAAAAPAGDSAVDMAVIVKLSRVVLLVPVALMIGIFAGRMGQDRSKNKFSLSAVPWFIFGFLAMSGLNTLELVPDTAATALVHIAYLLIGMAMAGLGLNVQFRAFRQLGLKACGAGFIGSVFLSILGYVLVVYVS